MVKVFIPQKKAAEEQTSTREEAATGNAEIDFLEEIRASDESVAKKPSVRFDEPRSDQRVCKRYPLNVRIAVTISGCTFEFKTLDISESGCSFYSDIQHHHEACSIKMTFPKRSHAAKADVIEIKGKIANVILSGERGFRVGVEFRDINQNDLAILKNKLKEKEQEHRNG